MSDKIKLHRLERKAILYISPVFFVPSQSQSGKSEITRRSEKNQANLSIRR